MIEIRVTVPSRPQEIGYETNQEVMVSFNDGVEMPGLIKEVVDIGIRTGLVLILDIPEDSVIPEIFPDEWLDSLKTSAFDGRVS